MRGAEYRQEGLASASALLATPIRAKTFVSALEEKSQKETMLEVPVGIQNVDVDLRSGFSVPPAPDLPELRLMEVI